MLFDLTTTQRQRRTLCSSCTRTRPGRSFDVAFGRVRVVYPEASAERCTAAPLLEFAGVRMTRRGP
jgi:hypothetical protein